MLPKRHEDPVGKHTKAANAGLAEMESDESFEVVQQLEGKSRVRRQPRIEAITNDDDDDDDDDDDPESEGESAGLSDGDGKMEFSCCEGECEDEGNSASDGDSDGGDEGESEVEEEEEEDEEGEATPPETLSRSGKPDAKVRFVLSSTPERVIHLCPGKREDPVEAARQNRRKECDEGEKGSY